MAQLTTVVFLLIFFVTCVLAKNDTSATQVTALQVISRPRGKSGNDNALAVFRKRSDACENNKDANSWKSKMEYWGDKLVAGGSVVGAVGAVAAAGTMGLAAPVAALGAVAVAVGATLGFFAKYYMPADPTEAETAKCLKQESEDLKHNMSATLNDLKTQFEELKNNMSIEFNNTRELMAKNHNEMMDELKKLNVMVKEVLEIVNESRAMITQLENIFTTTEYKKSIAEITLLQKKFATFFNFNGSITTIQKACETHQPEKVLLYLESIHIENLLLSETRKNYMLLKNRCTTMIADLFNAAFLSIECFAINHPRSEAAQQLNTNETIKSVESAIIKMGKGIQWAKDYTFNQELPTQLQRLANAGLSCSSVVDAFYSYVRHLHPWAEWLVTESAPYVIAKGLFAVKGTGVKEVATANCNFAFMGCERDDNVIRKENARRFQKWLKKLAECEWVDLATEDTEATLLHILSTSSVPSSHRLWNGIMFSKPDKWVPPTDQFRYTKFESNAAHIVYGDTKTCKRHPDEPRMKRGGDAEDFRFQPFLLKIAVCF